MEFWGIEVKGKAATKVTIEESHLLHLSQAVLSEVKKDGEPVTLYVKVDDKKLVLGIMSAEINPQLSFDLVFEKDFEISHNAKNGSVHLLGYMSERPMDDEIYSGSSEDEFDDVPLPIRQRLKEDAAIKAVASKAIAGEQTKIDKPKAEVISEDEDDDSDDDEDSDDESDEDTVDKSDDSDDDEGSKDDDEESSEEEETPVKVESGKKRKAEAKIPESKKEKLATPQKKIGKKSDAALIRSSIVRRDAPPGSRGGLIRAKRTGRLRGQAEEAARH